MEQAEIEEAVGELEMRIDRLRSLYDQYFMGLERLEPLVPRKDVERRLATLRKEQIRNSGLRFKFNVIAQRFNTYQTYWLRIARQIENGTYGRDVRRAKARFGVDPTKQQQAARERLASPLPPAPEPRIEIPQDAMDELEDGTAFLQPLDVEDDPFADLGPPAAPLAPPRERFASAVRLDLDDLADPFEEHDPFPKPAVPSPSAPKIRIAQRPPGSRSPPPAASAPPQPENRDTERRILAAAPPRIATRSASPPAQASGAPPPQPQQGRGNEPRVIIAKRASLPDELERQASARPPVPAAPPSSPSLQRPATLQGAGPPLVRAAQTAPGPSAPTARLSPVSAPPAAGSAPRVQAAPVAPSRAPAAVRPAASMSPGAPRVVPGPGAAGASVPSPAPVVSKAPPAAAPPPAARPATPPAAVPARVGDLSGDRFGQIYSKYVETRRERNEPTHAITREALAKQLADSTERLKQKHGGKPIDFEVVVKDGKTILRPVVK